MSWLPVSFGRCSVCTVLQPSDLFSHAVPRWHRVGVEKKRQARAQLGASLSWIGGDAAARERRDRNGALLSEDYLGNGSCSPMSVESRCQLDVLVDVGHCTLVNMRQRSPQTQSLQPVPCLGGSSGNARFSPVSWTARICLAWSRCELTHQNSDRK